MMILYQIVNRELVLVRALSAAEVASVGPDWDDWLKANGFGRDYSLRKGVVDDRPYRGPVPNVPSAASAILERIALLKGV
jgi:hypothetical protein